MALQTVVQKLAVVENQFDAPAMHNAADELGARLGQLSALLMSAGGGGLADMDRAQRSAYLFACLRVSEECEGIVRDMPLPPL
ncbi:MAG: hypothetical protein K0B16_08465 [Burkholderiaceae bacterium]|nr:hypothetical protein [Burkholderiaceae bacterium]